jgi:hypothetical protein
MNLHPRIITTRCQLDRESSSGKLVSALHESIISHHFQHRLQIYAAAPKDETVEAGLLKMLAPEVFSMATIQPSALLEKDFMESYVKNGSLYVLSVGQRSER